MRIDTFLKISLLFKTRSSASKAIIEGRVFLNEKQAKASSIIKINDTIRIIDHTTTKDYQVLLLLEKMFQKNLQKQCINYKMR